MIITIFKQSSIKLFNYIINLLIISYISKFYGPELLADYFIFIQFILLFSTISIFGFNIASQKSIPILLNNNNKNNDLSLFISSSFIISITISIFLSLIIFIIEKSNINFLYFKDDKYIFYLIMCIPIFVIILFINEILRSINKLIIGQIISLNFLPLCLLVSLIILSYKNNSYELLPIVFFLSYFISILISIYVLYKYKYLININLLFKIKLIKIIVKKHFVYLANSIISLLSIVGFTFILNLISIKNSVASYNLIIILSSVIGMPLIFLNNKYLKNISINLENKKHNSNYKLFHKISNLSLRIGLLGGIFIIIFLYLLSLKLFNIDFKDIIYPLLFANIAFLINNYFGPNQSLLLIYGFGKILNILTFIFLIFSLLFGYILIFYIDYYGAIISFLIYQLLINITLNIFIKNNIFTKNYIK